MALFLKDGNYDFRTTYGTQLKEAGISFAIVVDLMGHPDTRMVETIYARTRHEGVMKQLTSVESILGQAKQLLLIFFVII